MIRLGRPISTPWLISNEAGATISPRSRRYAPRAAAAAPVAGSSTTPPTGNGSRARNRSGASRQTSWSVVRSASSISALSASNGYSRRDSRDASRATRMRCLAPAKPIAGGSAGSSSDALPSEQLQGAGDELGAGLAHPGRDRRQRGPDVAVSAAFEADRHRAAVGGQDDLTGRPVRSTPTRRARARRGPRRWRSSRGRRTGPRPAG